MHRVLIFLVKASFCLLVLCILLFWLLTIPGTVDRRLIFSQDVSASRSLLASTITQLKSADQVIELQVEQAQLDALLNVASHTLNPVVSHGTISDAGVVIHLAYALPYPFGKRLVHSYCFFNETADGFVIEDCKVGKLPIAGAVAMFLFKSGIRLVLDSPADKQMLTLFQSGKISNGVVTFTGQEIQPIRLELNPLLYSGRRLSNEWLGGTKEFAPDIELYLAELQRIHLANSNEFRLAFYMQHLLVLAITRSEESSAAQEYMNVLWALAVGFGSKRFARYAKQELDSSDIPPLPVAILAGRQDLSLHFLYSAIIKDVGNAYIAEQIGILKELSDAGKGGSGFSFADYAANQAGIHFVQQIDNIDTKQILTLNTDEFEMAFFPPVHDLPEGIREQKLNQVLGGLGGEGVKELESIIKQRIADLSLFKPSKTIDKVSIAPRANPAPPLMTLVADLHLHSRFSDGSQDIDWLAMQAKAQGCDVIAVTDHTDLSNTKFDEQKYLDEISFARQRYTPLTVISGMEWNVPPFAGKEHLLLLVPEKSATPAMFRHFRERFDHEKRQLKGNALEAFDWLALEAPDAVLFYNHPNRKDFSYVENMADVRLWRKRHNSLIGFEGGPGHQKIQGERNGAYSWFYRTVNGWDPAVAIIGGQWDKLLQQQHQFWGALANSDYHTHTMDYLPCQYSRTHILVTENTEKGIFEALKAGRFYASHANFVKDVDFNIETDNGVRLYSGDQFRLEASTGFRVNLEVELNMRNFEGHPTWLDKLELIVITPHNIESLRLYPTVNDKRYSARWQGALQSDLVVIRARGAMQLTDGTMHYFYTNPIRLFK